MHTGVKQALLSLITVAFAVYAGSVKSQCNPDSTLFAYTGDTQTFVVPPCVVSITVKAWGAGGGGGGLDTYPGTPGGGGAYSSKTLAVLPGESLTVVVGGGGQAGGGCVTAIEAGPGGYGYGNGGTGGLAGPTGCSGSGGGGGGGTALLHGVTYLVVAGGGGGGGGGGNISGAGEGGGGGQNGWAGTGPGGITGASASINGTNGVDMPIDGGGPGGGGGGELGGTAGGDAGCDCGGGGGGGGGSFGSVILNGNATTPGYSNYPTLPFGDAVGGPANPGWGGQGGGNGFLIIEYCAASSFTLAMNSKGATCPASSDGSATVTITGGKSPYTYLWLPSGGTNATATGLSAGTYTVTVKDAGDCIDTESVVITQPATLSAAMGFTHASCNLSNGSATATVTGGTGPYKYVWTPSGQTTATATGLSASTYTVTVTDANGCNTTASVAVTQPAALSATKTVNNVLCFGGSTGSATANISGGTGPYTYKWAPSGGSNATANNLTAGTYTCTINDANGCITHDTVIVKQPTVLKDTVIATGSTCGGANGSANATASGGTGAYTYKWSPSGGTKASASGLSAGTYTVTLTDANGCTKTASVTIANVGAPSVTSTKVDLNCNGDANGSITTNVTGGASPYTYSWSPSGGTNASASGLTAGKYTCTITDAKGCVIEDTVTITEPPALTATLNAVSSTCGDANGSATVSPSGGVPPYTYKWTPSGGTNATALALSAGTYTCTVTDSHGCALTNNTIINNIGSVPLVNLCCDTVIAPGDSALLSTTGSGGVNYSWIPPDGLSCTTCPDPVATPTVTTTYTETVSDANGCTTEKVVTVTVEIPCSDFKVPNIFTPNDDGINDDFVVRVENPSSYNIIIYDRWGKKVYSSDDATRYWNGKYKNTNILVPDGVYYYDIKATCGTNSYAKKGFVQVIGRSK